MNDVNKQEVYDKTVKLEELLKEELAKEQAAKQAAPKQDSQPAVKDEGGKTSV